MLALRGLPRCSLSACYYRGSLRGPLLVKRTFSSDDKSKEGDSHSGELVSTAKAKEIPPPTKVIALPMIKEVPFPGMPIFIDSVPGFDKLGPDYPTHVGLFLVKDAIRDTIKHPKEFRITDLKDIHTFGVIASVLSYKNNPDNKMLYGTVRAEISSVISTTPNFMVNVEFAEPYPVDEYDEVVRAQNAELVAKVQHLMHVYQSSPFTRNLLAALPYRQVHNMEILADMAAGACTSNLQEAQAALEALDLKQRQAIVLWLVYKEQQLYELQDKIGRQMEDKAVKHQRKHFLHEQMKSIRKELGMEQDEKESLITKFKERLLEWKVPTDVRKLIDEELAKLASLEPVSSEYNVTRNYLEWLTALPWGTTTPEKLDIKHAEKVLDEDHYGLGDIKERIKEFIAVGKLTGNVEGKIILLVGPPGTGKTSIGKSIARALQREYYRFSVGGLTDVSEIKGHRRTYVGAMPGKILQCMKTVKTSNPVILIDEIDKLGRGHTGDPAAALLEVLDPEQNKTFLDHYLDVPFDLSKVLFVCTANVADTIPKPLIDRMEVMTLSGYIPDEKVAIAKKHLIPMCRKDTGLKIQQAQIKDSALKHLVRYFSRESGVRNLKNYIEKIFRKVAFNIVNRKKKSATASITVTDTNLSEFVGKTVFKGDRYYENTPVGVVMGLAWTAMGGATLYVETVIDKFQKGAELRTTGQMGDVMKESTNIAYTYAKTHLAQIAPGNRFFEHTALHMHIPEGATPKDGPSAGCTMVTSLFSLALGKSVRPNLAMTGEVTLTGKVLSIGGVREKTIAARRSGVTTLILPTGNKKDWDEVPANVKEGLEVHFVDSYDSIVKIAFPGLEERKPLVLGKPVASKPSTKRTTPTKHATPTKHTTPTKKIPLKQPKTTLPKKPVRFGAKRSYLKKSA